MPFPRDLLFLTLGIALGAGATILIVAPASSPDFPTKTEPPPSTRRADVSFVSPSPEIQTHPQSHSDRLLAEYHTTPVGEIRETLLVEFVESLAKTDPKAALAFLTSEDPEGLVSAAFVALGKEWASLDPSAASVWATGISDPYTQEAAVRGVCEGWAASRPLEAFLWVNSFPMAGARETGLVQVARLWSRADPQGALTHFAATPTLSRDALDEFAATWGRTATKEAVQALAASPVANSEELAALAITSGSLENPNVAIQALPFLRNTELRAQTRQNILRQVANENPRQAIQLAALSGGLDESSAVAIASGWAEEDSKAALEWAATLPPQVKTQTFAAAALASYTQEGTDLKQILERLPQDPAVRYGVLKRLADFEALQSPERLQHYLGTLPPSAERDRLASEIGLPKSN